MDQDIYDIDNYPMPSIETMETIINQMENSVCQIRVNNEIKGTGFLCNINLDDWETLKVLITTSYVLNEFDLFGKINISFNNKKFNKEILIDNNRKKFINHDYITNVTFIEIKKSDGLKGDSFLNIDEVIDSPEKTLTKMPIYSLHYPKGDVIKKSEGLIIRLLNNNYYINHLCKCDRLSSGGL